MWTFYSILKSTIEVHENIDISKYRKVITFLKRQEHDYIPNKSKVLSMDNVLQFMQDAPEYIYLLMKVVIVFGINGACRKCEMCNLLTSDIEDTGKIAVVNLRDTKTKKSRVLLLLRKVIVIIISKNMLQKDQKM